MFSNQNAVSIFFEIFNFVIFGGIAVYLFKRYFYASLKATMHQKERFIADLRHEKEVLKDRVKVLEKSIDEQEVLCAHLFHNVERWRAAFEQNIQHKKQEAALIQERLNKKAEIKKQYIELQAVEKQVLPHALAQTRQTLEQQFADDVQGKQFLRELIMHMERKA